MNPPPAAKRQRLSSVSELAGVRVHLEPDASDPASRAHEVFADGTYTPADTSHFRRVAIAASSFVSRAAAPAAAAPDAPDREWPARAIVPLDAALTELGRAVAVIEALRAAEPLLQLSRFAARPAPQGALPPSLLKDGGALLVGKRRALEQSARVLDGRVAVLRAWGVRDKEYHGVLRALRALCGGLRRAPDGTALLDVGYGDFVALERAPLEEKSASVVLHTPDAPRLAFCVVPVSTSVPAPVFFGVPGGDVAPKGELGALARRVRLSRVAAFRQLTFERLMREATEHDGTLDMTTNAVSVECRPSHAVVARRSVCGAAVGRAAFHAAQDSSILAIAAAHASLRLSARDPADARPALVDALSYAARARATTAGLERVLDQAARRLRVRVAWARGSAPADVSAQVWSSRADGDGPARLLASFAPVLDATCRGVREHLGHVRVTPAFGIAIAAPDDPWSRFRPGAHVLQASVAAHGGGQRVAVVLDDAPPAYVCPLVGGELLSGITLLLCVRLLDALEAAARAEQPHVLDVDRQRFSITVLAPRAVRTLRARVWPEGDGAGRERPATSVWLDDAPVPDFPGRARGRVEAWLDLLRQVVVPRPPAPAQTGPQPAQPAQPPQSVQPTQPAQPAQPAQTVQPVQAVQPVQTVQPAQQQPQLGGGMGMAMLGGDALGNGALDAVGLDGMGDGMGDGLHGGANGNGWADGDGGHAM